MTTPRDALNEMKWRYDALSELTIFYLHRGAPDDTMIIKGDDIVDLGRSFFTRRPMEDDIGEVMIPYHRIQRIERNGGAIWTRRESELGV